MRERVTLQSVSEAQSSTGYPSETWSAYGSFWAEMTYKPGASSEEKEMAGQETATTTAVFRMRYNSGVNQKHRIVYADQAWDIVNIAITPDRAYMQLTCKLWEDFIAETALKIASSAMTTGATLTANIQAVRVLYASITAGGTLIAEATTGNAVLIAESYLTTQSTLAATAKIAKQLNADATAYADLLATATRAQNASATMQGAATLEASVKIAKVAQLAASASATLYAVGEVSAQGVAIASALLSAQGNLIAALTLVKQAEANLTGSGQLIASATVAKMAEVVLQAEGVLVATAQAVKVANASMSATAETELTAIISRAVVADMYAEASTSLEATLARILQASATATATTEIEAKIARTVQATMTATATTSLQAVMAGQMVALLTASATLSATVQRAKIAAATTTGTATLSATGVRVPTKVTWNAILNLNSTATFLANAIALDTNAKAFFTAAGITNTTQQNAVNKFVKDLKSNSLWSKLTVIYPFVGGTASTHAVNLKSPGTYNATFNGTITHNASGVKGNGTTGYFNTGITPSAFPQNSVMIAAYYIDGTTNAALFDIGVLDGSGNGIKINSRSSFGQSKVQLNSSTITNNAHPNTSSGDFQAVNRSNDTQFSVFSSASTGTFSQTSTAPVSLNIFGLAVNYNGTATDFSTRGQSFFAIGTGFTNTEVETFRTLVRNMQADLSRS